MELKGPRFYRCCRGGCNRTSLEAELVRWPHWAAKMGRGEEQKFAKRSVRFIDRWGKEVEGKPLERKMWKEKVPVPRPHLCRRFR